MQKLMLGDRQTFPESQKEEGFLQGNSASGLVQCPLRAGAWQPSWLDDQWLGPQPNPLVPEISKS